MAPFLETKVCYSMGVSDPVIQAETHDDYDVFWERDGATVRVAVIGHAVGVDRTGRDDRDAITFNLPYAAE